MKNKLAYILFIFSFLGEDLKCQYEIFQGGVRIYNTYTGWGLSGQKLEFTQKYTFTKDTCLRGAKWFVVEKEFYDRNKWFKGNKTYIYFDTSQKKIYHNIVLLYDFNIQLDSTNKWGFTLDSIRWLPFKDSLAKFYFFTDKRLPELNRRYDIWLDGFGSLVLDYLNPIYGFEYDGYNYNYNARINFENKIELVKTELEKAHLNFKPIRKMADKDLSGLYISYHCNGINDTFYADDKCFNDTNYRYKISYSMDTPSHIHCLDTIHFRYSIEGKSDNKKIIWKTGSSFSIAQYPLKYNKSNDYTNSLKVMNLDSSCETNFNYDTIRPKCNYCENPKNRPILNISIEQDTLCQDTLRYHLDVSGESDSLWIFHKPNIDYSQVVEKQMIKFYFGNRYCIKDSISKPFWVDCKQQAYIANYLDSNWLIFPNPATDKIQLSSTHLFESLVIYDASGRIVQRTTPTKTIDISKFQNGLYYIQFYKKEGGRESRYFEKR